MEKITSFQIIDLTLSGFKSYNEPTTFAFGNPTAITGGNGRGKSSIADAIAFAVTGLPFFGENGIDRLHCDDNSNDLSISIRFADGDGAVHQLVRKRHKSTMYITFNGYDIRQKDLTSMFGEKDVFLSIFNPLYFIEELGDKGKHLLERHLPVISHEAILAEMSASSQAALKDKDMLSPDGCLKKLRGEIRSLEESIIYLTGQKDLAEQQAETMQTSYADLRNRLTTLAEEETALKHKQFEDLSIPQMQEQLVDLSNRYSDVAKDDTQMRQQLLETEVNHLRQQRAQRMEQGYESKFTATHAETTGMVKLLTEQYRKELTQAKALTIGGDCPTCHRPITEETLPQVQEAFKKVLESIVTQGREGRQQLDEISDMEKKAQETFEVFKAQDVATMDAKMEALYAQQEQLVNEDSGALDTLRTQIQELTSLLEYGNLSQEEYQRLHTCHNELMDCQGQIATLSRMVKDADTDFDSRISETEHLIGEKKSELKEIALYISKRAELLFSTLRMNRVEISLYDVVKSTGEVKDTFRFTYNGRRYDRLSLSEKIRAGMEVSELMKRLTGRNYPVFVDNMESVDDLANVRPTGQIIMAKCIPNTALAVHGKQAVQSQPMAA